MSKSEYWDEDLKTSYTAEEVQGFDLEAKKRIMEVWFRSNYEDPAERTPYESREGGYQWIWGGPYDANEVLGSEFSDIVDQELIDEVASELESECVEWAPTEKPSDYEDTTVNLVKSLVLFRFDAFAEAFVNFWIKSYKKSPQPTAIISILAVLITAFSLGMSIYSSEKKRMQGLEKTQSYSEQFELLKSTEQNLNNLSTFISSKKSEIEATKNLILELEKKKSELEPIVNANEKVVDAIFLQQRKEIEKSIWTERLISFGLGLLASLIATIIWHFVGRYKRKNSNK
jgi:hypothetical protein